MKVASITTWIMSVIFIAAVALLVYFLRLVIKALKTYIRSKEVREEKAKVAKSLGEVLKQHRTECKMTQEFLISKSKLVELEHELDYLQQQSMAYC